MPFNSVTARLNASIKCNRWLLASIVLSPIVLSASVQRPQGPSDPVFDVASVRVLEKPRFRASVVRALPGGRFEAANATLIDLIRYAFGLSRTDMVEDGPAWVRADRYDISATSSAEVATAATSAGGSIGPIQRMVQGLLADRFSLSVRRETRSRPGRILTVARSDGRLGPQLRPSTLDCVAAEAARIGRILAGENPAAPENQVDSCAVVTTNGKTRAAGHTMEQFAGVLSNMLSGEPVLDRTGLKGPFVIELTAAPANAPIKFLEAVSELGPALDVALNEQLGLKLERGPVEVDVIVIKGVERPTPN